MGYTVPPDRLALDGGTPIRRSMLPYGHQVIDESDIEAVVRVLRSEWLTTGPAVNAFEKAFAAFVGAKHAVAVSSGTAALHAASFAAGIKPGDEVVVAAMTFPASANCVRYQGGTVVFADVRPDTLTIDPDRVKELLTPKTRAIVAVDYGGHPSEMDELLILGRRNNCVVIEDASHALGASYKGRKIGALTSLTTFSLHPVKQMTTGEGGVITTDDDALAAQLRIFRSHGITTDAHQRESVGSWLYEMVSLGYNYRLTDLQCALGLSQIQKLPKWLARRRQIAVQYSAAFQELPEIQTTAILPNRDPAWHLYVIRLNLERLRVNRTQIFTALRAENLGVNVHYIPVPWHPYYQKLGCRKGEWPVAENAYERMITLPLWAGMTDQDVDDVIAAVRKVCHAYRA